MYEQQSLESDLTAVARLLGRQPSGEFVVVVRNPQGVPMVIRNYPYLHDGTPMPTLFWLCDPDLNRRVSTLEADGGVRRAQAEIPRDDIEDAHRRYSALRETFIDDSRTESGRSTGPRPSARRSARPSARPSGGVAGTRTGVKCLHAHFAWHLAGGDDAVGRWVESNLPD